MTCILTGIFVQEDHLLPLSFILLLLNLFSSVQDIAVDSLAVNILDESELGAGNTVQVVAYKAGSMLAGSLLLIVREAFGWTTMFLTFGAIYFIANGLFLHSRNGQHIQVKMVTKSLPNGVFMLRRNLWSKLYSLSTK